MDAREINPAEAYAPNNSSFDSLAAQALKFILREFDNQREPSMKDVAKHLETTTGELGKLLNLLGVDAQSTSRNWEHKRLYPRKLRARI